MFYMILRANNYASANNQMTHYVGSLQLKVFNCDYGMDKSLQLFTNMMFCEM